MTVKTSPGRSGRAVESDYAVIGKDVAFVDGREKISGKAQFLDDLALPGMLFGKILRSPHPHARIKSIDTSRALSYPGVKAVITAADCPRIKFGLTDPDVYMLAVDKVRYVGDDVAAVAATSREAAAEALKRIDVEYEVLPAVNDVQAATRPGAPLLHDDKPGNIAKTYRIERGDVEADFAQCDHVFEESFSTSPVWPCYLEPFGAIAQWDASGRLTIWSGLQSVFHARAEIAKALGISVSNVVVKAPFVGGAFGGKIWIRNFHAIAAVLARKTGRPVKIVLTRQEEFLCSRTRVAADITIKLGFRKDGTLVCKQTRVLADNGAYSWAAPKILLNMSVRTDCLYRFYSTRTESFLVYTNRIPSSGFRGYGNAQMHFALESMIDTCCRRLGWDPVAIRLKNCVRQGDSTLHGWNLRSCGLAECIEKAQRAIQHGRQPKQDADGRIRRGVGLACMTHVSGNRSADNFDGSSAMVRFQEDGRLFVYSGEMDMGQGAKTVFAQIAAETLGLPLETVYVVPVDTDISPFCYGTYSSRVTTVGGKAVYLAAQKLRGQLLEFAAKLIEEAADHLQIRDGVIFVADDPAKQISVEKVCQKAIRTKATVGLVSFVAYDPPSIGADKTQYGDYSSAYTYGAQAVEVEVDTLTGEVRVLRIAAAHDVGYAINTMAVQGQITGGIAQALGWALYENPVAKNGVLLNTSFSNYLIPCSVDVPKIDIHIVETIDPIGPYGAKGIGEPTIIPAAPAIGNAIEDALGIRIGELPFTAERVYRALQAARCRSAAAD
jgi:CO/xanthine dehydrogenase Mo-binding subunit